MSISFNGKKFKVKPEVVHFLFKDVEMKTLNLTKKKIDSISNLIGLEKLDDLEALILDNNRITKIEKIPDLKNLKFLSLKNNSIQDIKVIGDLPQLIQLNLMGNKLTKVPRSNFLPNLTVLSLAANKITKIENLETLPNLEHLILDVNLITEIENLESLNRLSALSLSHNLITEVKNINECRTLRYLFLKNNRITKISPIRLKFLDGIDLIGNPYYTYLKSRFTNLTAQKIIEYSIDSERLEKRLQVGRTNVFVPIDYSNVRRLIPRNEEILYSTLCYVKEKLLNGKSRWKSHLLITESGIAISVPQGYGTVDGKFFEWSDIWEIKLKKADGTLTLIRHPKKINSLFITLSRDMDFESSESFANRRKTFLDFCISHWEEYRKKENIGIKRTFYCDTCGADITSENPKCNKCGADNEERIKKLRKFEENEKWIKSSEQLSSSAILAATTAKRGSRAERVRRQQSINIRNTANSADRMTKAKIKLIIGETHEGKLGWIKTQLDLKRTVTEIADDLDESMIRVAKYVDEIVKQDKTED